MRLYSPSPLALLFDRHHGAPFVLRVDGVRVGDYPSGIAEPSITLELALEPADTLLLEMESFAAVMAIPLATGTPGDDWVEKPLLAACHVPAANLFIFAEESRLVATSPSRDRLRLTITGVFRSRRLPCKEADLTIHLEPPAAGRLLSLLYTLARRRQ